MHKFCPGTKFLYICVDKKVGVDKKVMVPMLEDFILTLKYYFAMLKNKCVGGFIQCNPFCV